MPAIAIIDRLLLTRFITKSIASLAQTAGNQKLKDDSKRSLAPGQSYRKIAAYDSLSTKRINTSTLNRLSLPEDILLLSLEHSLTHKSNKFCMLLRDLADIREKVNKKYF